MSLSKAFGCPCCAERVGKRGGFRFILASNAPPDACEACVAPKPPSAFEAAADPRLLTGEVPPFVWPRNVDDVEKSVTSVIIDNKRALDAIADLGATGLDADLRFHTVVEPMMQLPIYKTNKMVCQAKHMQHCHTNADIRAAATKATTALANSKEESKTRKDVYATVKRYSDLLDAGKTGETLSEYQQHFVGSILRVFERGGLALSETDSKKLADLLEADADVCNKYKTNLGEDSTKVEFTVAELEGCDPDWIKERIQGDKVILTLKYPDLLPVLQNCPVSNTRKKLALAREQAYGNNLDLVAEGIPLRKQAASILGYKSWAHYVTSGRMSGSPEAVTEFLGGIGDKAKIGAQADKERLRKLKESHLIERGETKNGDEVKLEAWDVSFYHAHLLKTEYGVDHEVIRKYFPCSVVVEGTLEIYQELLGLKFTEIQKFDTWHEDVRLFVVHDVSTKERLGHFYLDLHPREGKYNHAAIFHILKRTCFPDGKVQTPVDCMLCNLPAPTKDPATSESKPALLRHDDVVTFFHEFGHIMHGICSEGTGNSTTLAKCPRDFVEAPSQMLENWCYEEKVLQKLSKHVETGLPLPKAQIQSLLDAKNVSEGLMMLRQLYLSLLDLEIHGEKPPSNGAQGLQDLVNRMRPEISLIENPEGCNMLRNFGHLMKQYSAAYYGYLWAEVLSADMFESRFAKDPFSKENGMAYRKTVLAPGGTGKIAQHLERFLGHKPSQEPFLRSRGILK